MTQHLMLFSKLKYDKTHCRIKQFRKTNHILINYCKHYDVESTLNSMFMFYITLVNVKATKTQKQQFIHHVNGIITHKI